jgi:predicted glutamine amidotransferase
MCRWMAYSGEPILAEELLFRPTHSIIGQSLHAKLQRYTTNGDGFGIGWYGDSTNARRVQEHTPRLERPRSARDRRTDTHTATARTHPRLERDPSAAQQLPPVPARPMVVNAQRSLAGFQKMKRDLMMEVDPSLFADIEGSTDTETLFFLALTFGIEEDPPNAVARAVSLVEEVGHRHGIQYPVHMTVATSDGESITARRGGPPARGRAAHRGADGARSGPRVACHLAAPSCPE